MPENSFVDMKVNSSTGGCVYFASDVICTIAGLALTEIEGVANVVRYAGLRNDKNVKKNAVNIKNLTKGIRADVKENTVAISINAIIEYGYSVPEVSKSIQENVKKTVETMTGMTVDTVDVHVTGLNFDKENSALPDADYHNFIPGGNAKVIADASSQKSEGE